MTQSNDMPTEIYAVPVAVNGQFGCWKTTGVGTKYTRADLTPPQSPNRAVLDALDKWDNQGEINHEELCLFIECTREHLKRQKGR